MNILGISTDLFDDSDSSFDSIDSTISSSSLDSSATSEDMNSTRSSIMSHNTTSSEGSTDASEPSQSDEHSNNISNNEEQEESFNTAHSSDTEPYDFDDEVERQNGEIIEINDTQMPDVAGIIDDDEDDDVILIPQNIETIDLCTQVIPTPIRLHNEVIDITNSPSMENSHAGPIRRRRNRRSSQAEYQAPIVQQPASTSNNLLQNLDLNDSQPRLTLTCPICLDSIVNHHPVSTLCGHLFCKNCIQQALRNVKKCPMCKKTLRGNKPFFDIYLSQ